MRLFERDRLRQGLEDWTLWDGTGNHSHEGSVGMIISRKEFFENGDQNFNVITNGIGTYDEPAMDILFRPTCF